MRRAMWNTLAVYGIIGVISNAIVFFDNKSEK